MPGRGHGQSKAGAPFAVSQLDRRFTSTVTEEPSGPPALATLHLIVDHLRGLFLGTRTIDGVEILGDGPTRTFGDHDAGDYSFRAVAPEHLDHLILLVSGLFDFERGVGVHAAIGVGACPMMRHR